MYINAFYLLDEIRKAGRRSRSSSVEGVRYGSVNKPPSGQATSTSRQLYGKNFGSRPRTSSGKYKGNLCLLPFDHLHKLVVVPVVFHQEDLL